MKPRITMFIVLSIVVSSVLSPASAAEPCQDANGTFTCPMLAPTLPAAGAAEAAATQNDTVSAADRLTLRERRKLGFTKLKALGATFRLARQGALPSTKGLTGDELEATRAEIRETLAIEVMGENIQAWDEIVGDRDWSEFLNALADFFERIMPIIEALIDRFGGLAMDATLTPTVTVADCVRRYSPPVMLAA